MFDGPHSSTNFVRGLSIGYALLGMVCFGDVTDRFGDVGETFRTLFAVVNGDIIYDTFNAIEFAGLGGQLYLYVYILIFTYGKYFAFFCRRQFLSQVWKSFLLNGGHVCHL